MKRTLMGLIGMAALVAGAGVAALSWRAPERAFACSGPPTHQQMASASVILEGRIVSAAENAAASDVGFRGFDLQIEVTTGIRGVSAGERLAVRARVPSGQQPVICPQWDRDETFLGKFVVGGLFGEQGATPVLDRWGTAYLGLDPGSSEYAEAVRVARVAAGDPAMPQLRASTSGACPAAVHVRGWGFEPGSRLLLWYPLSFDPDGRHPAVQADASGSFSYRFELPADDCVLRFVEAYPWREDRRFGGWPLAMAQFTDGEAPLPPDAGNSYLNTGGGPASWWLLACLAALLVAVLALRHRPVR